MSEKPITTLAELADEMDELSHAASETIQQVYGAGLGLTRPNVKVWATRAFHHANRILDYLGTDRCKDGETPAARMAREFADTPSLMTRLAEEKSRVAALHAALAAIVQWSRQDHDDSSWWVWMAVNERLEKAGLDADVFARM